MRKRRMKVLNNEYIIAYHTNIYNKTKGMLV
jgi:hypothetical protein